MQIDKQTVLELLRERGQTDQVAEAERELPDQVDTDRDAGLLERFGIQPNDLITRFTGGQNIPGF